MKKYDNNLFLDTLSGAEVSRPPVWLMRQAGRILPQYRAVRARLSGFKELVSTPELVAEVTIQPVDELGVDAAIIFSDILVIPECMGLDYEMIEKKGPRFPRVIKNEQDIIDLREGAEAAAHLSYVYDGIKLTKKQLNNRVPLIGFSGSPFTLLCYMVEGQGSKTFSKAKKLLYKDPAVAHQLLEKITNTTIAYLDSKIKSGVDAIQLFDSWAGVLDRETYKTFCIPYIERITKAIEKQVPVIIFSKGAWFSLAEIKEINSTAVGIDWNIPINYVRSIMPDKVLQGNLDPCVLYADRTEIRKKALQMINSFGKNHIVNLGHGVYPDTPLDGVREFVETVKSFSY
jgi:uroporphyrinogen decarboxylase